MTDPYRDPTAHWVPSPNLWPNRNGFSPNYVSESDPAFLVLHTEDCASEQIAEDVFLNTASQRSAHYGIRLTADADDQFVDEGDGAWHSGNGWMNENSSGFEHEDDGNYNGPRTPTLYFKSMTRVEDYTKRRNIPLDRQHVIRHDEVAAVVAKYGQQARGITSTGCPDSLDADRIVKGAQLIRAGQVEAAKELAGLAPLIVTGKPTDVVLAVNVTGRVYQGGTIYSFAASDGMVTLAGNGSSVGVGTNLTYTSAIFVNGKWFDLVGPGAYICDDDLDTSDAAHPNGSSPADYRPAAVTPPPAPAPVPAPPPAPAPVPAPQPAPTPTPPASEPEIGLFLKLIIAILKVLAGGRA